MILSNNYWSEQAHILTWYWYGCHSLIILGLACNIALKFCIRKPKSPRFLALLTVHSPVYLQVHTHYKNLGRYSALVCLETSFSSSYPLCLSIWSKVVGIKKWKIFWNPNSNNGQKGSFWVQWGASKLYCKENHFCHTTWEQFIRNTSYRHFVHNKCNMTELVKYIFTGTGSQAP